MLRSALLCSTCRCMPLARFPPVARTHISCQSPSSACVQRCHERRASVISPPFPGLFSLSWITGVSGRLRRQQHHPSQGFSACSLLCQQGHILLLQPNGTKMDLKFLAVPACIFLFEHMRARYSHVSSHFRLCRPFRSSALPAGNSTDGKNNPEFIALLCVIFPVSGSHLPFGARQSGIWEGKVLV